MALHHSRSLSFPSASHPAVSHFDENLSRLRSSEAACSSLSSINATIRSSNCDSPCLRDFDFSGESIEIFRDCLLVALIHQPRCKWPQIEIVSEECVDDYISLLDASSSVKDLISLVKEDLRELLSAVRRKDVRGINGYLALRKQSKKKIQKCLKMLENGGDYIEV
ncbi:uncharacterized protein LOC130990808 [Salvia miltiorrhiza]|uniref:uncharacterized protein LOC130990808 n=1 Tax=Salvia miltiorrhiza TaxID=226208 RepID=UPI0025AB9578|nr:uncharacterized protein LOC130990808 [Salvia miltiorrhiza]